MRNLLSQAISKLAQPETFKLGHHRDASEASPLTRLFYYLFVVAFTGAALGALTAWYIAFRLPYWPLHPDAVHVAPYDNHGATHYMERIEGFWITNMWWLVMPCWAVLMGFIVWSRLPGRDNETTNSSQDTTP
jgi:hypothetical protein